MGEWRVFIERKNDETDFDLWRALKVPLTAITPVQSRSDTYFVATHDVGVKFRGDGPTTKPLLEIKVRLSRKKRGVEKWEKILTAPVDCDPRAFGHIELRRELEQLGFLSGKHSPQLQAVLKMWSKEAPVRLSLSSRSSFRGLSRRARREAPRLLPW